MKGSRILLVDDEVVFTQNMSKLLTNRGYRVTAVNSGDSAIRELEEEDFDVIVLDLKMPGMDGITTLKEIKKLGLFTETLILTGHGSIDTALEATKIGAYDYLTKPFSVGELLARIMALLRRHGQYAKDIDVVRVGSNQVDVKHFIVRRGKKEYSLSHYEAELFRLLYARANQPVTRDEILDQVWGTEKYPTNRTVDNFIVKLRKKIEVDYKNPKHILTIYGVGYKLSP